MATSKISFFKTYLKGLKFSDYILCLLLILIPIYNKLMPLTLVLFFFSAIPNRISFQAFINNLNPKLPAFWFLCFFLFHIIGMSYTQNTAIGWNDIASKLSFLIIPILLAATKIKLSLKQICDVFLVGLFFSCIFAFSYASYRSLIHAENNNWAYFKESYLSFSMHRSYYATYLVFGIIISVRRLFMNRWYLIPTLFLVSTLFLTYSKAGILIFMILIIPVIFFGFYNLNRRLFAYSISILIPLLFFCLIMLSPTLKNRFTWMINSFNNPSLSNNFESNQTRIIMWQASLAVIKDSPIIGHGTGEVNEVLSNYNLKVGNKIHAEKKFNSHNQYLNTTIQLGILGLIPLIVIFYTSLSKSLKTKNIEFSYLIIIIFLTMLFESFLQTQAGIIPVTLLFVLFSIKSNSSENINSDTILSS